MRRGRAEEKHEGVVRTERSYGTFFRSIALPEGAKTDVATAKFKDGILEIGVPLAEKKPVGRRMLSIEEEPAEKAQKDLVGA